MTEQDIQNKLWKYFDSGYKYHLENSYVFNWESDFFCIANSGYVYEIEIKLSRADFFADFNKTDKHRLLQADRPFTIKGFEQYSGHIYINGQKRWYGYKDCGWEKTPIRTTFHYAFPDKSRPNKFIYAVPKGLIEPEEVPDYAGLMYVDNGCYYAKRPPTIHKNKLNLEKTLLDKFYWAYRRLKYE